MAESVIPNPHPKWSFAGLVQDSIYANNWACPADGVVIAYATSNTSGGAAYWYIYDSTLDAQVCHMTQMANGTSQTSAFPVQAGHIYQTNNHLANYTAPVAYYYKML